MVPGRCIYIFKFFEYRRISLETYRESGVELRTGILIGLITWLLSMELYE